MATISFLLGPHQALDDKTFAASTGAVAIRFLRTG
jgi:hypothetical protein